MKSDINGCSSCQPGQESFEKFVARIGSKTYESIQYDFRTEEGKLFSCVAKTLEDARNKRDHWLKINNK